MADEVKQDGPSLEVPTDAVAEAAAVSEPSVVDAMPPVPAPTKAAPAKRGPGKVGATPAKRAKPKAPAAIVAAAPVPAAPVVSEIPEAPIPVMKSVKPAAASRKTKSPAPRKEQFKMTTPTEFTEKFQSSFKDASEKAKAAFGDMGAFAKGNVEAVVESSKILALGLQEMSKGYVTESKSAMESLTSELKGLTTVKSPTEFFEKQSALLRKQFDAAVAASSKNSEAMLKLANEAFQPISTRVSLAVEKMKQAA